MTLKKTSGRVPDDPVFETEQMVCFLKRFQLGPEERHGFLPKRVKPELLTSLNSVSKELCLLNNSSPQSDKGPFKAHTVTAAEGKDYERENEGNRWTGEAKHAAGLYEFTIFIVNMPLSLSFSLSLRRCCDVKPGILNNMFKQTFF